MFAAAAQNARPRPILASAGARCAKLVADTRGEYARRRQPRPEKLTTEELGQIAGLDAAKLDMLAAWANKKLTCAHCKRCTLRCEVLKEPDLDMGQVEEGYGAIAALPFDDQPAAVLQLVQDRPELYHALRRCCFCGFCTATCQTHVLAPERMRDWRVLFMRAGLMPPDDSKLVMVDNEWNIFSAYRAVYGIGYPELASLEQAAEHGPGLADTLFFPGCSLVSYAPELTRTVGRWLTDNGVAWALSTDCCGSPLMSAGLFDRAAALRQRILDQIRAAGIVRVVTVCPGCGEEFVELMGDEVDIVPLPELLLQKSRAAERAGRPTGFAPLPERSVTFFDSCHDRFDGDVTERRVWRIIDEARATGAETLVTTCPTCTYTVAQACLGAPPERGIGNRHYLELLFGQTIDWPQVFAQLGGMWEGEYGPWLTQTFFA